MLKAMAWLVKCDPQMVKNLSFATNVPGEDSYDKSVTPVFLQKDVRSTQDRPKTLVDWLARWTMGNKSPYLNKVEGKERHETDLWPLKTHTHKYRLCLPLPKSKQNAFSIVSF